VVVVEIIGLGDLHELLDVALHVICYQEDMIDFINVLALCWQYYIVELNGENIIGHLGELT
jgi:hypothetical protein